MELFLSLTLHLVMAALVRASVVAASPYYVHRRTVNQLLELKHRIEEEQKAESEHKKRRRRHHSKNYGQNSSSMPEFAAVRGLLESNTAEHQKKLSSCEGGNGIVDQRRGSSTNLTMIPSGLPRVQMQREGTFL